MQNAGYCKKCGKELHSKDRFGTCRSCQQSTMSTLIKGGKGLLGIAGVVAVAIIGAKQKDGDA